jgi:Ca2+-binding RTX toxin-like protein/subtilisin family serine protease
LIALKDAILRWWADPNRLWRGDGDLDPHELSLLRLLDAQQVPLLDRIPGVDWSESVRNDRPTSAKEQPSPGETTAEEPDPFARTVHFIPTEPFFPNQWHLLNLGQTGGPAGIDINVTSVWDDYDGTGIKVGVYDDSVQYTHHDLNDNYVAARHLVIGGVVQDPQHNEDQGDDHGTRVAGLIAAELNGVGTMGVAYRAQLTGYDALDASFSSLSTAMNLQDAFDVVNHSWGFTNRWADNILSSTYTTFFNGLADAANNGRGGLGTIQVVAAGNSNGYGNNRLLNSASTANDANFSNSQYVVAVAAVASDGFVARYSEEGASLLISAPSSGVVGITTTDPLGTDGGNFAESPAGDYTTGFGGTSAAAPIVTGVVALMLEANPNLGWRDVMQILAYSASGVGGTVIGDTIQGSERYLWAFNGARDWNGGGLHFSHDYGFGLVNALAAVRLAETWTGQKTSANDTSVSNTFSSPLNIPDNNATGITFNIQLAAGVTVETLRIRMGISHTFASDLVITVTSPSGMVSTLQNRTGGDTDLDGWTFSSNAFRGEDSGGTWTVSVRDLGAGNGGGSISSTTLTAIGSPATNDNLYVFTDEFVTYGGFSGRDVLTDTSGIDTINAAAVTSNLVINLAAGAVSTIAGRSLTIAAGTTIENAYGGDGNDTITGNSAANRLVGGRGNDTLNGAGGADIMIGGTGNDTYVVNNAGDFIVEDAGVGTDTVRSSISWTLGSNLEHLTLTGSGDINGTGNALANTITGNSGNNNIDGSFGADTMLGGAGNDNYYVDNVGDSVVENLDQGNDGVFTSMNGYRLPDNVEILVLQGIADLEGYGNALANTLIGNSASNFLDGDANNDLLLGLAGVDVLRGGAGNDTLDGGDGIDWADFSDLASRVIVDLLANQATSGADVDTLGAIENAIGTSFDDVFIGNSVNNVFDGHDGDDTMIGSLGNDIFRGHGGTNTGSYVGLVDIGGSPVDIAVDLASGTATATITHAGQSFQKNDFLFDVVNAFGGVGDDTLLGNAAANILKGGGGNDALDGRGGADEMRGGAGNDFYVVDDPLDQVIEEVGEGAADTVSTRFGYVLGANVERLILTGTENINGTGNAANNELIGNDGNNTLDGAGGADVMHGEAGDDVYIVDNVLDQVIERPTIIGVGFFYYGNDTVRTALQNYVLAANVENLILTGTGNINGTGNSDANSLTGNSGNNILDGGAGIDDMTGGAGNDTYYVDNAGDTVTENASGGIDTIMSSITFSLLALTNIENLTLIGSASINGTGGSGVNTLTGNSGNNTLDGQGGADTMAGGNGLDIYMVDSSFDQVIEYANEGTDVVYASASYQLRDNVEYLYLTGAGNISGYGNALNNYLQGNSGNNVIDGGAGADTMIGGHGIDVYFADSSFDVIVENVNEGTDVVYSGVAYQLGDNLARIMQCAPTARITSGGRFHPESCRLIW